jgi:hypothetical protein
MTQSPSLGARFAEALAHKDWQAIGELLHPELDFMGVTPGRQWQETKPEAFITEVLQQWFDESDHIEELVGFSEGMVGDRAHVTYRFAGHNPDGPFVVEQQAYYDEAEGRISYLRTLCSGYRPA